MREKEASNISIIGGHDGPSSVFIGSKQKLSLLQKVHRAEFKFRKSWYENHITEGSHTMEEVRRYIKNIYGFNEVDRQSQEYQAGYIQLRASFILQYEPELLGKYAERPQFKFNRRDEEEIKSFIEQNNLRQQEAEAVWREVFDIDFHIYKKEFNDVCMKFFLESKYGYIGGGVIGNKVYHKKYNKMYRDIYRYYGITKEDINNRTKRYENLIRTLARR